MKWLTETFNKYKIRLKKLQPRCKLFYNGGLAAGFQYIPPPFTETCIKMYSNWENDLDSLLYVINVILYLMAVFQQARKEAKAERQSNLEKRLDSWGGHRYKRECQFMSDTCSSWSSWEKMHVLSTTEFQEMLERGREDIRSWISWVCLSLKGLLFMEELVTKSEEKAL